MHIKNDDKRLYYPACINDTCKKKVIEDIHMGQTVYRCEACQKTFSECRPTFMITAKIADFTDSLYVNFAREHGTAIMGMTAEQFKEFRDSSDEETINEYMDGLLYKPYNIMVKGRFEYY